MARAGEGPPLVRFYQLAQLPLEQALARLLAKAWERGLKGCVLAGERGRELDDFLWRYPGGPSFLPHGPCDGPDAPRHPVLLCREPDDRNGATVLFVAVPRVVETPGQFDMVVDFVDGRDTASLEASRQRYRFYRARNCRLEYWVQGENGAWVEKK